MFARAHADGQSTSRDSTTSRVLSLPLGKQSEFSPPPEAGGGFGNRARVRDSRTRDAPSLPPKMPHPSPFSTDCLLVHFHTPLRRGSQSHESPVDGSESAALELRKGCSDSGAADRRTYPARSSRLARARLSRSFLPSASPRLPRLSAAPGSRAPRAVPRVSSLARNATTERNVTGRRSWPPPPPRSRPRASPFAATPSGRAPRPARSPRRRPAAARTASLGARSRTPPRAWRRLPSPRPRASGGRRWSSWGPGGAPSPSSSP